MTLLLEWTPDAHPRWPKGTPHTGHIGAGEFMRIGDLLAKLSTQPSGTEDLSFLARGSQRIRSVIARRDSDPTRLEFDVHLNDGTSHAIGAGISTDFSEVMGALQHIDQGGAIGVQPGQDVLHRGQPAKVAAVDAASGIAQVAGADGKPRFVPRDQLTHAPKLKPPTGGPPKQPPGDGAATGATPGPRERLKTGLTVHTPNGRGTVVKSGSGYATVSHDSGGSAAFANSDLRVPGGTRGSVNADRQGRTRAEVTPMKGGVIATVHHADGSVSRTSHANAELAVQHITTRHGLSERQIKVPSETTGSPSPLGSKRIRVSKQTQSKHPEVQKILGGRWRDTQDKFSEVVNGKREYGPERKKLHDRIVDMHLRERGEVGKDEKGKPIIGLRDDTPYLTPQKLKEVLFTAGGPSAGKSNAVDNSGLTPPQSMIIDADGVEKMLPERDAILKAGQEGKYTGYAAHNEALDITNRIIGEAQKKGLNITVDGNGDTNSGRFKRMLEDFQSKGYKMHMVMVDIPTDMAARNVDLRANGTKFKKGDGRYINIDRVRQVYRTARLNQRIWRDMPGVNWQIYDNSAAIGEIIKAAEEGRKPDFAGKASRLVAAKKPNGQILYGRDALKDAGSEAAINASLGLAPKAAEKLYREIVGGDR